MGNLPEAVPAEVNVVFADKTLLSTAPLALVNSSSGLVYRICHLHDLHAVTFVKESDRIIHRDPVVSRDLAGCNSPLADPFSRALEYNGHVHSETRC